MKHPNPVFTVPVSGNVQLLALELDERTLLINPLDLDNTYRRQAKVLDRAMSID